MAWELIASTGVIIMLIVVNVMTVSAGLKKVRCLDELSKTLREQRKKTAQLELEVTSLKARLREARRENSALIANAEDFQRQVVIATNKLKAANLIIEQTSRIQGGKR